MGGGGIPLARSSDAPLDLPAYVALGLLLVVSSPRGDRDTPLLIARLSLVSLDRLLGEGSKAMEFRHGLRVLLELDEILGQGLRTQSGLGLGLGLGQDRGPQLRLRFRFKALR